MASTRRSPADFTDRQWADRWVHRDKFDYIVRTADRVTQGPLNELGGGTVRIGSRLILRKRITNITAIPRTASQPLH